MSIQTTIQLRIEEGLKEKASNALKNMGLDLSSGIKLFLTEVATSEAIPFFPSTSHGKKLKNFEQIKKEVAWAKKYGKKYTNADDMIRDLLA